MQIILGDRTEETVTRYFERAQDERIRSALPQKAKTLGEALQDYRRTLLPGATSYGRTIWAGSQYAGDIWCYGIAPADTPQAMVSYCVFPEYWGQGIATAALAQFVDEAVQRFNIHIFGAFTYESNLSSRRVLERSGFVLMETFTEDGIPSCYYERS